MITKITETATLESEDTIKDHMFRSNHYPP